MTLRQLRIYAVRAEQRGAFYTRWEMHARPIMAEHGFELADEWEGRSDQVSPNPPMQVLSLLPAGRHPLRPRRDRRLFEFGDLLSWESEEQMRSAWTAFLADERWQQAKATTRANGGEPVVMATGRLIETRPETTY